MSRYLVGLLGVCALAAIGVGYLLVPSDAGGPEPHYALEPSASCLSNVPGVTVDRSGSDFIAEQASGGSFRLSVNGDSVVLAFAANSRQASQILARYLTLARLVQASSDLLARVGNVVVAWGLTLPAEEDRKRVLGCLTKG